MPWPMIAEIADTDRPREKLYLRGANALTDVELLGLVLNSGTRDMSVLELSRQMLQAHQGSLLQLSNVKQTELESIRGIGPAKAGSLLAVFELAKRLMSARSGEESLIISSPESAGRYVLSKLGAFDQEEVHVLLLSARNRVIHSEMVSRGLLDRASLHPREVFRMAVRHACARVMLVHNHPSGDPTPSEQDRQVTRQLKEAGEVLGIELLDHVVVGSAPESRHGGLLRVASAMV